MTIDKISPIDGNSAAIERYQAMINRPPASHVSDKSIPADTAPASPKTKDETAAADTSPKKDKTTYDEYKQRAEKLNAQLSANNIRLLFGVEGKVFYLKVVDMNNGEVVKQIPPKEIMEYINRTEQDLAALTQQKLL